LGAKLCELRIAHGLTQEKLGKRLGISSMQVHKYERGIDRLSASRMFAIAHLFDMPVTTFFEELL